MAGIPSLVALLAAAAAGAALAKWLRVPMWPFTGAVVAVALFHVLSDTTVALPGWWSLVAQILVGTAVGARLGRGILAEFRSVLVPGALVVVTLIPLGVGLGLLVHEQTGLPVLDTVFGLVPGGVGEMVAASAGLGGNSALVAGMHLVRLLIIVWTVNVLVAAIRRNQRPEAS
jgi:uncharacterized protein